MVELEIRGPAALDALTIVSRPNATLDVGRNWLPSRVRLEPCSLAIDGQGRGRLVKEVAHFGRRLVERLCEEAFVAVGTLK